MLLAVRFGNEETVKTILDFGAEPTARDIFGSTTLSITTWEGSLSLVKLLLEHEADVDARGDNGVSLLQTAADENEDVVRCLIEAGAHFTKFNVGLLYSAIEKGNLRILQQLLEVVLKRMRMKGAMRVCARKRLKQAFQKRSNCSIKGGTNVLHSRARVHRSRYLS